MEATNWLGLDFLILLKITFLSGHSWFHFNFIIYSVFQKISYLCNHLLIYNSLREYWTSKPSYSLYWPHSLNQLQKTLNQLTLLGPNSIDQFQKKMFPSHSSLGWRRLSFYCRGFFFCWNDPQLTKRINSRFVWVWMGRRNSKSSSRIEQRKYSLQIQRLLSKKRNVEPED